MKEKDDSSKGTYEAMGKRVDDFLKALRDPMKRTPVVPNHQNPIRVVDGGGTGSGPGVTTLHVDDEGDSAEHDPEASHP